MAGVRVRVSLDRQAFRAMEQPGGMIESGVRRAAGVVRDNAKRNITAAGRVDTGRMRNSIESQRMSRGNGVWYEVASRLPYALYQHEGTKDHGPRRARVLRFKPKGSSVYVFARRVRGVRGVPFLTDALRRLTARDFYP